MEVDDQMIRIGRWEYRDNREGVRVAGAEHPLGEPLSWRPTNASEYEIVEEIVCLREQLAEAVGALQALVPYLTRGGVPIDGPDARAIRKIVGEALTRAPGQCREVPRDAY